MLKQIVDCGTKQALKTDTSGAAKCVPLYVTNTAYEVRQVERNVYHSPLHLLCTQGVQEMLLIYLIPRLPRPSIKVLHFSSCVPLTCMPISQIS